MNEETIKKNYEVAKERYAAFGVDTDKAIATLEQTPISLHCWQADDVVGFERNDALSGGIMTTGNFPGRARNIDELRQDIEKVQSMLAGTFRLNLHETYGDFGGKFVDRDQVETNAQRKLEKKNADFIVLNSLQNKGTCFRTDDNQIEIISRVDKKNYPKCSKAETAVYIVDELERVVASK